MGPVAVEGGPICKATSNVYKGLCVIDDSCDIVCKREGFQRGNYSSIWSIDDDVDVQKLEAEQLRKGKSKAEEDLNNLKMDYKKLRLSMRTVGLGKTSEQWRQEIREEKGKVDG
ncbi:hypothetical protein Gotri_021858 [Gossypium trilobum]|uniref:Knottins-like domain-containing protein n=1 Tax=Gossypium trilobum TaxID=34281 RepID=A0A7J9DE25_9ROSI|nr:hypothetical protein [Gossypium trilobum]